MRYCAPVKYLIMTFFLTRGRCMFASLIIATWTSTTSSITMPQSKKLNLPSLTPILQYLLDLYKKAAIVVAGAVAVPATLAIVGFAPAGIAAGKYLTRSSL